jgi:general stress protein YciG
MEGRGENAMKRTANRGFASMDREQQRAIARKGGLAVSQNRQHMAEIGRKGGESSGESRGRKNNPQPVPQTEQQQPAGNE